MSLFYTLHMVSYHMFNMLTLVQYVVGYNFWHLLFVYMLKLDVNNLQKNFQTWTYLKLCLKQRNSKNMLCFK